MTSIVCPSCGMSTLMDGMCTLPGCSSHADQSLGEDILRDAADQASLFDPELEKTLRDMAADYAAPPTSQGAEMSRYEVSEYRVYPTGYNEATFSDKFTWTITVVERGSGQWAVQGLFGVLNREGEWEYEPSPSNREDDFLERCRFTKDEALMLALAAVDQVVINGVTCAQADLEVKLRSACSVNPEVEPK